MPGPREPRGVTGSWLSTTFLNIPRPSIATSWDVHIPPGQAVPGLVRCTMGRNPKPMPGDVGGVQRRFDSLDAVPRG